MNVTIYRVWLHNDGAFVAVGINGKDRPVVGISRVSGAHACVDLWSNATTLEDPVTSRREGAKTFVWLYGDRLWAAWPAADEADRMTAAESLRPCERLDLHAGFDLSPHPPLAVAS